MISTFAKDSYDGADAKFQVKSLIHSRTVVEKEAYVSTGILAHVEGDLMEIEMSEYKSFELGDPVSLTIYSPVGIHRLESTVIAKAENSLAVIFPPRALAGLEEKRESPRVEVLLGGSFERKLNRVVRTKDGLEQIESSETVDISVVNISLSGIGFVATGCPELQRDDIIDATIEIGGGLQCRLEIVRKDNDAEPCYFGARYMELDDVRQRSLRAFLLREQIAIYYRAKQQKTAKGN
ncbi:PilZ domain-containing protein [Paenibacillus humicola]|uniref:PilZ domain-containing protein n=1 Tax=Paenibacillus humicola TaxID=3110540 RepID=UPI00237C03FB|nr:PilZ domain-containing protein [Paenibacillus humicola]